MTTESFTSSALGVSSTTAAMTTESFTSSALGDSSGTVAKLGVDLDGTRLFVVASATYEIRVKTNGLNKGVYLLDANGNPVTYPISLDDMRTIAPALIEQVT